MDYEQKKQEELIKANFNLLKLLLCDFIKNEFNVCDNFVKELNNCDDNDDLSRLFKKYNDEVYERLGGEPDLQDEVDRLERKVRRLQDSNEELESKLEDAKVTFGETLNDEYKRDYITQYHNDYTPWELEELLKNGKKYLKK